MSKRIALGLLAALSWSYVAAEELTCANVRKSAIVMADAISDLSYQCIEAGSLTEDSCIAVMEALEITTANQLVRKAVKCSVLTNKPLSKKELETLGRSGEATKQLRSRYLSDDVHF